MQNLFDCQRHPSPFQLEPKDRTTIEKSRVASRSNIHEVSLRRFSFTYTYTYINIVGKSVPLRSKQPWKLYTRSPSILVENNKGWYIGFKGEGGTLENDSRVCRCLIESLFARETSENNGRRANWKQKLGQFSIFHDLIGVIFFDDRKRHFFNNLSLSRPFTF